MFYGRETDVGHIGTFGCVGSATLPKVMLGKLGDRDRGLCHGLECSFMTGRDAPVAARTPAYAADDGSVAERRCV